MGARFLLDKSSKKFDCPGCGHVKKFKRFIDESTGEYLPMKYGRCDRQDHCRYFLSPYRDGYAGSGHSPYRTNPVQKVSKPDPAFIPDDILLDTIKAGYDNNVFIQNLLHRVPFPFTPEDVEKVIMLYRLGTIKTGS